MICNKGIVGQFSKCGDAVSCYMNWCGGLRYVLPVVYIPVIGKSTYRFVFPSKYSVPLITTRWAGKLTPHARVLVAISTCKKVSSVGVLYIGQYPVRWTAQSALLFTPWQTYSFRYQLGFSRKHSSRAAITHEHYSLTFPPLSKARYSFIQMSDLECHGENENAQTLKW